MALKRGFFFSLDALLAMLLLVGGLLVLTSITQESQSTSQMSTASQDLISGLRSTKIYDLEDPWVKQLVINGTIEDDSVSVIEQIGTFWALEMDDDSKRLAGIWLNDTYTQYGLRLSIQGDEIFYRNTTKSNLDTAVASQMITGIAQGEALTGSSASAYLKRIKDKRTLSFTTLGGFVGQGNISERFVDLPADANITEIRFEAASGASFTVGFNGNPCSGTLTPPNFNGTPGAWDLSSCNASLLPGSTNIIDITFNGQLNESYIAGGFLKVKYKTETLNENATEGFAQEYISGVDGIVNLFDSFNVPGDLKNMSVYLHYEAANDSYFQIGHSKVWEDNPAGAERKVILNDTYLQDPAGGALIYEQLSNTTVPIRFAGFEQTSKLVNRSDLDIVLITDYSGSMKKSVSSWTQGDAGNGCDDDGESPPPNSIYDDDSIRKTEVAVCVDKVFTTKILGNGTGNRVWPVFLHQDKVRWIQDSDPTEESVVEGYIDSFSQGNGKTCYACALNMAHSIFSNYSNESRKKFIVFMTDGVPTHCQAGSCTSTSTSYGTKYCEGLCDIQGNQNCASDIASQCSQCTTNNQGQTAAYYSANRNVDDFNTTIYTVGFGPVDDCSLAGETLEQIANIGNGTYQRSNDTAQLKLIYENISQEILSQATLASQVAIVEGNGSESRLYDDSHINITFDLAQQYELTQNTISVTLQADRACNPQVHLYSGQGLIESQAVSYSGIHWTDHVLVNGEEAFNLSNFFRPYDELGDPTLIYTPVQNYTIGTNTIVIETGDSPTNRSGCSVNNTAFYTVRVNLSTERSTVVPNSQGCKWLVEFEDGTFDNITIPSSYSGNNSCHYTSSLIEYDNDDAYQLGAYEIFNKLDLKKNGQLFVNLNDEDLEIIVTTISGIPYLWGPVTAKIEVIR